MARIGVLGLEPFLVTQVEQLDRRTDVVLMDPLDDEDRDALEVDVVLVSQDHAAATRLLAAHPSPPVVVVDDGVPGEEATEPARGEPRQLHRPVSSPQLREAIDRSLGMPAWRRALRSITIEQDDAAVPDRWMAVLRTLVALGALAYGVWQVEAVGVLPLVVLTGWLLARALWWRLTTAMVLLDVVVVWAALIGWGNVEAVPLVALALLAATVAAEAGFLWGWWRTFGGMVVVVAATFFLWWRFFEQDPGDVAGGAATVVLLVVTASAAGAMAKRLWFDHTQTRSSQLRRFRSSLYELSRRQAVVAVSFDLGTVADDALSRVLAEVKPTAAMVLVADGPGPLQVAASHNLTRPPPVRLTWQPGVSDAPADAVAGPVLGPTTGAADRPSRAAQPDGADDTPEWRPSWEREEDQGDGREDAGTPDDASTEHAADEASDAEVLAAFPDIDPGADLVTDDRDGHDRSGEVEGHADDPSTEQVAADGAEQSDDPPPEELRAPPPAWSAHEGNGEVGSLARRLALRKAQAAAGQDTQHPPDPDATAPSPGVDEDGADWWRHDTVATNGPPGRSQVVGRDGRSPSDDERDRAVPPAIDESPEGPAVDASGEPTADRPARPPAAWRATERSAPASRVTAAGPPGRSVPAAANSQSAREVAHANHDEPPSGGLLDRATINGAHGSRLRDVMAQLGASLPDGAVRVDACELDGELMGALVVVGAQDAASVARHAEETALALDSVRLFNRLRAFTRDQERARIGRSLHDGVMQTLAHVAFELDRVSRDSWDESQVDTLGRLRDHVLGTVDEMRTVVNDLRTVRLDRGLPSALEAMALTLSPAGGPVIETQVEEVRPLPGDVEEQFLRVAEEALNNAVQHSGARRVVVRLETRDGAVLLQVLDDGFGFSQARVGDEDGGVGLTSMYQRARSIGAGLDIDTGANGTIITLHHAVTPPQSPPPGTTDEPGQVGGPSDPRSRWWRRGG